MTEAIARPVGRLADRRSHRPLWYVTPLATTVAAAIVVEMHLADLEHGTHLLVLLVVVVGTALVFGPGPGGIGLALSGGVAAIASMLAAEPVANIHDVLVQLAAYLVVGTAFIAVSMVSRARRPGPVRGPRPATPAPATTAAATPAPAPMTSAIPATARSLPEIPEALTTREHEVLSLAATGMSVDEVAHQLCLSPNTVKTHLTRVYGKLAAHGRTDAIRIALHSGWLTPADICPHLRGGPSDETESPVSVTTTGH